MEAVVFYLVKVWQELGSSFLCLQCAISASESPVQHQSPMLSLLCRAPLQTEAGSVRSGLLLPFRCILAQWSLSVHTPGGCLQPPGLWRSMQIPLPPTASPVLTVPLQPCFVAQMWHTWCQILNAAVTLVANAHLARGARTSGTLLLPSSHFPAI